uniref:Uncharacterized protein n=1 Tax=Romanomermis culicivorax TaxID=13658 RepID=A0A915KAP7_ROMCU
MLSVMFEGDDLFQVKIGGPYGQFITILFLLYFVERRQKYNVPRPDSYFDISQRRECKTCRKYGWSQRPWSSPCFVLKRVESTPRHTLHNL